MSVQQGNKTVSECSLNNAGWIISGGSRGGTRSTRPPPPPPPPPPPVQNKHSCIGKSLFTPAQALRARAGVENSAWSVVVARILHPCAIVWRNPRALCWRAFPRTYHVLNVTGHARGKTRGKVLAEYCLLVIFCLVGNTGYWGNLPPWSEHCTERTLCTERIFRLVGANTVLWANLPPWSEPVLIEHCVLSEHFCLSRISIGNGFIEGLMQVSIKCLHFQTSHKIQSLFFMCVVDGNQNNL